MAEQPKKKAAARKPAAKKTTTKRAPRPPAKKTAAAPPSPPERGRATKGPTTPPERGRNLRAPASRGRGAKGTAPAATPGRSAPSPGKKGGTILARVAQPKPGATYHRWVLAEFVACIILAVVGGVLSPRKRADGSLTWAKLLMQLTSISLVFFVLALLSAGQKMGKVAAAFGLLVVLGVLMNSTDSIEAMAKVFGPWSSSSNSSAGGSSASGGGQ